jgi:hypothetical protein
MTTTAHVIRIAFYKDEFVSSRPWRADIHWSDNTVWSGWASGFRTKRALLAHIEATAGAVLVEDSFSVERWNDI